MVLVRVSDDNVLKNPICHVLVQIGSDGRNALILRARINENVGIPRLDVGAVPRVGGAKLGEMDRKLAT